MRVPCVREPRRCHARFANGCCTFLGPPLSRLCRRWGDRLATGGACRAGVKNCCGGQTPKGEGVSKAFQRLWQIDSSFLDNIPALHTIVGMGSVSRGDQPLQLVPRVGDCLERQRHVPRQGLAVETVLHRRVLENARSPSAVPAAWQNRPFTPCGIAPAACPSNYRKAPTCCAANPSCGDRDSVPPSEARAVGQAGRPKERYVHQQSTAAGLHLQPCSGRSSGCKLRGRCQHPSWRWCRGQRQHPSCRWCRGQQQCRQRRAASTIR